LLLTEVDVLSMTLLLPIENGFGFIWKYFWLTLKTHEMESRMNDDEQLLLFSFLLYWVTFILYLTKIREKKRAFFLHLSFHAIYSLFFLHGLFYRSQGNGTALAWWFFLLLFLWVHWLILLGFIVFQRLNAKKNLRKDE
jgi:hypothetical protein